MRSDCWLKKNWGPVPEETGSFPPVHCWSPESMWLSSSARGQGWGEQGFKSQTHHFVAAQFWHVINISELGISCIKYGQVLPTTVCHKGIKRSQVDEMSRGEHDLVAELPITQYPQMCIPVRPTIPSSGLDRWPNPGQGFSFWKKARNTFGSREGFQRNLFFVLQLHGMLCCTVQIRKWKCWEEYIMQMFIK